MARRRHYNQDQVYDLVRSVGGSDHEARFLASVVPPESGGRLNVVNSIGATGLFQLYYGYQGHGYGLLNRPRAQAKRALQKLRTQGKRAWSPSQHGWVPYHGHGTGRGGARGLARGRRGRRGRALHLRVGTPVRGPSVQLGRTQVDYGRAITDSLLAGATGRRHGHLLQDVMYRAGTAKYTKNVPAHNDPGLVRYESMRIPGARGRRGRRGRPAPRGHTRVVLQPGADRPGVRTSHFLLRVLSGVQGVGTLRIGTGSNHNRLTVNGNVSDHWDGKAADIPATGRRGDLIAGRVLMRLGVSRAQARRMARKGGLFNISHGGHRWQVIWKTGEGGNHYNHVHVGVR